MKPGSTDGFLTMLASLLVAALLFVGRTVIENRGNIWEAGRQTGKAVEPQSNPTSTDSAPSIDWTKSDSEDFASQPSFPNEEVTVGQTRETTTASVPASSDAFKVVGVIDGDTIDVLVNRSPFRLRLNGIDTPEKGQPFGNNAKDALSKLIGGKSVQYIVRDSDRYGRSIADVYLNNLHVNQWLVEQGLAWHYVAYSNDAKLEAAEAEAKAAQRGIWSDPRRVAPWNWRKLSKLERDEFR